MSKEEIRDYNQIDALKYLLEIGETYKEECTESGIYYALSNIIKASPRRYKQSELDNLLGLESED